MPLFKYSKLVGPSWFRNLLARNVPIPTLNRANKIITTIATESERILVDKKVALRAGDDKVVEQVGEGKDIMSILRELLYLEYGPFLKSFPCH